MEFAANVSQNRSRFPQIIAVARSKKVSELQKSEVQKWVEAGVWLDVILGGMVLVSVVGLTLSFLGR
jgi:hypothetical protein